MKRLGTFRIWHLLAAVTLIAVGLGLARIRLGAKEAAPEIVHLRLTTQDTIMVGEHELFDVRHLPVYIGKERASIRLRAPRDDRPMIVTTESGATRAHRQEVLAAALQMGFSDIHFLPAN